jgi:hypothetical protein
MLESYRYNYWLNRRLKPYYRKTSQIWQFFWLPILDDRTVRSRRDSLIITDTNNVNRYLLYPSIEYLVCLWQLLFHMASNQYQCVYKPVAVPPLPCIDPLSLHPVTTLPYVAWLVSACPSLSKEQFCAASRSTALAHATSFLRPFSLLSTLMTYLAARSGSKSNPCIPVDSSQLSSNSFLRRTWISRWRSFFPTTFSGSFGCSYPLLLQILK